LLNYSVPGGNENLGLKNADLIGSNIPRRGVGADDGFEPEFSWILIVWACDCLSLCIPAGLRLWESQVGCVDTQKLSLCH
jgi:hypothetical protein